MCACQWPHLFDAFETCCALQDINRFDLYSNPEGGPEAGGMASDPILQLRKLRALHFLLCYETSGQEQLKGRGLLMVDCFSGYSPLPGQERQNAGIVGNLVTMSLQRGRKRHTSTGSGLTPSVFIQIGTLLHGLLHPPSQWVMSPQVILYGRPQKCPSRVF